LNKNCCPPFKIDDAAVFCPPLLLYIRNICNGAGIAFVWGIVAAIKHNQMANVANNKNGAENCWEVDENEDGLWLNNFVLIFVAYFCLNSMSLTGQFIFDILFNSICCGVILGQLRFLCFVGKIGSKIGGRIQYLNGIEGK
jgi:hypothetical protein